MLTRLCDRCGASAEQTDITKTVIIPQADPATNTVDGDCEVLLKIQIDKKDLCDACLSSAVWEFALGKLGADRLGGLVKSLMSSGSAKASKAKR